MISGRWGGAQKNRWRGRGNLKSMCFQSIAGIVFNRLLSQSSVEIIIQIAFTATSHSCSAMLIQKF